MFVGAKFNSFLTQLKEYNKTYPFAYRTSIGATLFVGEGNLSFSLSVAKLIGGRTRNIVATTLEDQRALSLEARYNANRLKAKGATVLYKIDATKLTDRFRNNVFSTIIFQFPNTGSRQPKFGRNSNHHLLRKFLVSCRACLAEHGEVVVTLVNRPHYIGAIDVNGAASKAGYRRPNVFAFRPLDFPGYQHTNTNDQESAISRFRSFSTWVFQPR